MKYIIISIILVIGSLVHAAEYNYTIVIVSDAVVNKVYHTNSFCRGENGIYISNHPEFRCGLNKRNWELFIPYFQIKVIHKNDNEKYNKNKNEKHQGKY